MFPLPQPLPLPQTPSEDNIKDNLIKYSPFYRQAMHFNGEGVETLFYVAHDNFSSEKALKKLQAFGLFKDKKIVFAEFQRSEDRLRDPPAEGLLEGDHIMDIGPGTRAAIMASDAISEPSAHQHGPGDHFTVKVKMPDSYLSNELIIYGDGKCGIVASIVALKEIDGNWVLFYDVDTENEKIVKSDPNHPYDKLLHKEYKSEVIHYKGLEAPQYGDEKLHYHVSADLTLVRNSDWFSSLEVSLQERVSALLDNTTDTHLLSPKEVHKIISTNVAQLDPAKLEKVANISPQHIHEIPSDETMARGAVAVIPSSVLRGEEKEGIELRKDAKHEFRIIVLNILHEWIDTANQDFSKINEDKFLESLIKEKLGEKSVEKIKTELGGEITFKSLLAIGDSPELSKEREDFYSAQFSFGDSVQGHEGNSENPSNKVWEKIKDIVDKYCSEDNFQTTNTDFITSFSSALEASMHIGGMKQVDKDILKVAKSEFKNKHNLNIQTNFPGHGQPAPAPAPAPTPPAPRAPAQIPRAPAKVEPAPAQPDQAQPDSAQTARSRQNVDDCFKPIYSLSEANTAPDLPGHGDARSDSTPSCFKPILPLREAKPAPAPAPAPAQPAPTANSPKVGADDSWGQLGNFMQTALCDIGKAFENLGEVIKTICKDARKNLLEKNIEQLERKPQNDQGEQDNKQTSKTPKNNPSNTIFSALRSCLGEERNK